METESCVYTHAIWNNYQLANTQKTDEDNWGVTRNKEKRCMNRVGHFFWYRVPEKAYSSVKEALIFLICAHKQLRKALKKYTCMTGAVLESIWFVIHFHLFFQLNVKIKIAPFEKSANYT